VAKDTTGDPAMVALPVTARLAVVRVLLITKFATLAGMRFQALFTPS
jgi:hypothetical protein